MRNDAHAVEPQQHGTTRAVGVKLRIQIHEGRHERIGVCFVLRFANCSEQRFDHRLHRALQAFQRNVASEAVGDHDIHFGGHDVATFDVANEVDARVC